MSDADILVLLKESLTEVVPGRDSDWSKVTLDTTIDDLSVDSVTFMELVSAVEERVGKVFPDDKLAQLTNFRDLAALAQG
jgi:acyl carrier protein